jgi:hypothetical protein
MNTSSGGIHHGWYSALIFKPIFRLLLQALDSFINLLFTGCPTPVTRLQFY